MNWIFKLITKVTLIGKLVEKLGPKVPIIFIFIVLIFAAFYIPYEYENILEFKQKYPEDNVGLILNYKTLNNFNSFTYLDHFCV